jgi:hypothetical protein
MFLGHETGIDRKAVTPADLPSAPVLPSTNHRRPPGVATHPFTPMDMSPSTSWIEGTSPSYPRAQAAWVCHEDTGTTPGSKGRDAQLPRRPTTPWLRNTRRRVAQDEAADLPVEADRKLVHRAHEGHDEGGLAGALRSGGGRC